MEGSSWKASGNGGGGKKSPTGGGGKKPHQSMAVQNGSSSSDKSVVEILDESSNTSVEMLMDEGSTQSSIATAAILDVTDDDDDNLYGGFSGGGKKGAEKGEKKAKEQQKKLVAYSDDDDVEEEEDQDYEPERYTPSPVDDDSEFFDANEKDEEASLQALQQGQIPLIPTDFTSIDEAMQNFAVVFESRYGANHPQFFNMTLAEAQSYAFELPGGDIMERKPLAIYLHNDNSVASHIFAQSVICSDAVSNLLQKQFVSWPWDMTQAANRTKLYEWLTVSGMDSVAQDLRGVSLDRYPLLVVIIKEKGSYSVASVSFGHDDIAAVVDKLMRGVDMYHDIRMRDVEAEQGRIERELFRQEQADEYDRSLAADMAKREQREREANAQRQADRERAEKGARLAERRDQIRATLEEQQQQQASASSSSSQGEMVRIRVQFPNGTRIDRQFAATDSLELLFNTVFINDACPEDFSLLYDYPQKPLVGALPDWYRDEFPSLENTGGYGRPMPTFQAAGIQKSTVVIVQNNAA